MGELKLFLVSEEILSGVDVVDWLNVLLAQLTDELLDDHDLIKMVFALENRLSAN